MLHTLLPTSNRAHLRISIVVQMGEMYRDAFQDYHGQVTDILDAIFLLTVGSFLLTVELFYLQLTILAFWLTVGAFSLAF